MSALSFLSNGFKRHEWISFDLNGVRSERPVMTSRQSHSRPSVLRNIWQKFHRLTLWIDNNNTRFIQSLIYLIRTVIIVYKVRHNAHKRGENLHFRFKSIGINIWLTKARFEITKSILSCGHARFRAEPKVLSCTKKSFVKWKIVQKLC